MGRAAAAKPRKESSKAKASAVAASTSTRKPRKKKDPNAPKRALTAFMFFSSYIREIVKEEMPELTFLQISSEIGRRWASLSDNDKKKFTAKAEDDKARYLREKEDYLPDPAYENQGGKVKGTRKKKDPNAPKRALSAYFYFCDEHRPATREQHPGKKITEIASLLAEMWRALPEKKRTKYNKMAAEAKEKYGEKMAAYKLSLTAHDDEDEEEEVEEVEEVEEEEEEEEDEDDDE
ncbi:hypothetical protein SPRG_05304 [Saprolegnia parasitica CBS 223.65]|uniref:HMG box domain-containing protein n=1 Tax=Saprolegnia parasitica (strain CBS 223.65) TaxID=695850 RepID=A0A067CTK6_SAPPC|nr:hypothetical protein SPRG_05304 [Saprolegnia parasitica CBS 223.65]KDO30112.1 hypothetical protein SPRG_05304 [Saprolegnia parasitica CBS 223.65]|eukprot:XP_012199292.1 hypothetical protein SPRG_05304 [Saprolegnia parasitica CBS 223.65]